MGKPKIVRALATHSVVQIASGYKHSIALTNRELTLRIHNVSLTVIAFNPVALIGQLPVNGKINCARLLYRTHCSYIMPRQSFVIL